MKQFNPMQCGGKCLVQAKNTNITENTTILTEVRTSVNYIAFTNDGAYLTSESLVGFYWIAKNII